MGDDMVEFDEWLTEAAVRAGYTGHGSTAELARAAGVDPGQMSRFLNGKAVPSSGNLPGLADALNVSVDEMARRIAGLEVRAIDGSKLTPEQAIAALGLTDPDDQAAVLAVIERLRARPATPQKLAEAPAKPKRGSKPKADQGQVDPLVMETLGTVLKNRHKRLLNTPSSTPDAPEAEEQATRGIGWLPGMTPPESASGPEQWFSPEAPEE